MAKQSNNRVIKVLIIFFVLFFVSVYNQLVQLRQRVKNAWSQIDVQLQRRFDLIPNLVETVKGLKNHEQSVLENLTKLRAKAYEKSGMQEKANLNNEFNNILISSKTEHLSFHPGRQRILFLII